MLNALKRLACAALLLAAGLTARAADAPNAGAKILTPPPAPAPRINGPSIFGVRPGHPFLYTIPATGERPMEFVVDNLPEGLTLDAATGQITGALKEAGEHWVTLRAKNAKGEAKKKFRIVVGEKIALTPPMGWNSWNCWAEAVDQEKVLKSARAFVDKGLVNHGWTYINIDDTWQGKRAGKDGALLANEKFPDMKGLCDQIHKMGLKAGIYSTPWITSYAKFPGGASNNPQGAWSQAVEGDPKVGHAHGMYSFARADANQWAAWGFDYLKYDWAPNDVPHISEMSQALRDSGRDILYSLSNSAPFELGADLAKWANCWRTTGDIVDSWGSENVAKGGWQYGVSEIGFSEDKWAPFAGRGHWNDPDMMVLGWVGWGPKLHATRLTPDEQYSHISLWCMLSAPLLIGCDLDRLDDFTLGLLTNDEVLALDQDALGLQAVRVATDGPVDVYKKQLEDGSVALGLFNRNSSEHTLAFNKMPRIGMEGKWTARDLWRQQDLPNVNDGVIKATIPAHGVLLLKMKQIEKAPKKK